MDPLDSSSNKPIYLDYSATTPVDPRVVEQMVPYLYQQFGNPASRSHAYGWAAEQAVETAREQVAALIGAGTLPAVGPEPCRDGCARNPRCRRGFPRAARNRRMFCHRPRLRGRAWRRR